MQKGFSAILIIIGAAVALAVLGRIYFNNQKNNTVPSTTVTVKSPTTFQELLKKHCSMRKYNEPYRGLILEESKINLSVLPVKIALDDLKTQKGECAWGNKNPNMEFVEVPLGYEDSVNYDSKSFVTISDSESNHCCEGPSSIEPTGKLVKSDGNISIYIHTGHWFEGPNSTYKPIIVRGVKAITLPNGEEIRIVLDREAINEDDTNLQKLEDKYRIIDPTFDSGVKVITTEIADKILMDSFFANFSDSQIVKKVENDLQSITIKN